MLALVTLLAATPVQLQYTRAPDASLCVSDDELRAAVVRRLGYVPFDDAAEDVLRVDVAPKAPGFVARLVRTTPSGARRGERELFTPRSDCADLGETLAFALSVAIDPLLLFRGPIDAGESPTPPDGGEVAQPPPDAGTFDAGTPPDAGLLAAEPTTFALEPFGGVAVGASWGFAPGGALSLRGEVALRVGWLSIGLLLRAEFLGRLAVSTGTIDATPLQAGLVPCVHLSGLSVCGLVTAGAVLASASSSGGANMRVTPAASAGARVSYELRFGRSRPFAFVEGGAALARTSMFVGDTEVWISPPGWAAGGFGLFFGGP